MIKTTATIKDGIICNNEAKENAGGGIRVDGKLTLIGGTITGNSAKTTGGGIDYSAGILYGDDFQNVYDNTAETSGNELYPDPEKNKDWTKDDSLKLRKINVELFKSYIKDRETQGMTITDKYIVFTLWKTNTDTTMIAIANKNTGEILNIIDNNYFGHASDMTWDSRRDELYILTNSKKIAKFKINDSYEMTDLSYIDCAQIYSAIAYNSDDDEFIGMKGKEMFIMNNKFEEVFSFQSPTNLTTQGMGYYNGNIYFCCSESGVTSQFQTLFNNKEKRSNLIYKYDLEGNLIETLYIPNTTLFGEIESCAFQENGKLLVSYNITLDGKNTVSLYTSEIFAKVNNITIAKKPHKLQYIQNNEELDLTGGELVVTYNDESTENLELSNQKIKITGFDNSKIGKQTINVEYEGFVTTFDVTIIENVNEEYIRGDINQDKKITITDLILLKRHLIADTNEGWKLSNERQWLADINEDGKISITDLVLLKRIILKNN